MTWGAYIKETHKTMNNINSTQDVIAWAKEIVAANGDKYTPLSKDDQYAIAKYIMETAASEDKAPEAEKDTSPAQPPTAVGTADPKPAVVEVRKPTPEETCTSGGKDTTTATMMRSYALHRAGYTVQQAYDEFLKWSKEHPKEATVMDFSTGVKSNNAAFAYWLAEIISVEVPTTTTVRG